MAGDIRMYPVFKGVLGLKREQECAQTKWLCVYGNAEFELASFRSDTHS
jgi:hypothetical protein